MKGKIILFAFVCLFVCLFVCCLVVCLCLPCNDMSHLSAVNSVLNLVSIAMI